MSNSSISNAKAMAVLGQQGLLSEIGNFVYTRQLGLTCKEIHGALGRAGGGQLTMLASERYLTSAAWRQRLQALNGAKHLTLQLSIGVDPVPIQDRVTRERFAGPELDYLREVKGVTLRIEGRSSRIVLIELEKLRELNNVVLVKWSSRLEFDQRVLDRIPDSVTQIEFHGVEFVSDGVNLRGKRRRIAMIACTLRGPSSMNLRNAESLVGLDVSKSDISDFNFASEAKNLRSLTAHACGVRTLSGISLLPNLVALDISSTNIDGISELENTKIGILDIKSPFSRFRTSGEDGIAHLPDSESIRSEARAPPHADNCISSRGHIKTGNLKPVLTLCVDVLSTKQNF